MGVIIKVIVGVSDTVVNASAGVMVETGVAEGEDVRVSEHDDVGVVVVKWEETVLGFVELGQTDGKACRKGHDLGQHLAISVENGIIRLVKEVTFRIGRGIAGDTVLGGDRKGLTIMLNFLEREEDRVKALVGMVDLVAAEKVGRGHHKNKGRRRNRGNELSNDSRRFRRLEGRVGFHVT